MANPPVKSSIDWKEQLRRHPELSDVSTWPLPDAIDGLKNTQLSKFYCRRATVSKVVGGRSVMEEAARPEVGVRQILRLLNRALGSQPDGDPLLLDGLVPNRLRHARARRLLTLGESLCVQPIFSGGEEKLRG